MKLTVIAVQATNEYDIAWLELYTPTGSFTIYRGHAPMIVRLAENKTVIFKLKTGKQQSVVAKSGIAHVQREMVQLLIQSEL